MREGVGIKTLTDGELVVSRYVGDVSVGEAAVYSADRTQAWAIKDGSLQDVKEISLGEAQRIRERIENGSSDCTTRRLPAAAAPPVPAAAPPVPAAAPPVPAAAPPVATPASSAAARWRPQAYTGPVRTRAGRQRVCFSLQFEASKLGEYLTDHERVWPEMQQALVDCGWHNYSLFYRPDGFAIGYFETDADFGEACKRMETHAVNAKWQAAMAKYTCSGDSPLVDAGPLTHYFYLGDDVEATASSTTATPTTATPTTATPTTPRPPSKGPLLAALGIGMGLGLGLGLSLRKVRSA